MPNFLTAFIAAMTSSDLRRFFAFDIPLASDANKTHLILKLLSPGIKIVLLKLSIFLLITIFDIKDYLKLKDSPKYALFASILLTNSVGEPSAIILQLLNIIAMSTQANKSLA